MNSVNLTGRLSSDVEVRHNPQNGNAVTRFRLAVQRPGSSGQDTDFIPIVVFGKQGENCGKYLAKGKQCAISGRIQTGSYTNRNGDKVYTTDVIAERVDFLGSRNDTNEAPARPRGEQAYFDSIADNFAEVDTDIPF